MAPTTFDICSDTPDVLSLISTLTDSMDHLFSSQHKQQIKEA